MAGIMKKMGNIYNPHGKKGKRGIIILVKVESSPLLPGSLMEMKNTMWIPMVFG